MSVADGCSLFLGLAITLLFARRPVLAFSTRVALVATAGLALAYTTAPPSLDRAMVAVALAVANVLFLAFAGIDVVAQGEKSRSRDSRDRRR